MKILVQDRFTPNTIHMDKFFHKRWKITFVAQSFSNPFTEVLGLVGCQVTSKILGIGTFEINWKDYKHVQRGQRSRMQSDSYNKQAILHGAVNMYKHYIMGRICVYNWTDMMVEMGLDKILHHDKEILHVRIFNAWIEDWE